MEGSLPISEKDITEALSRYYAGNCRYKLSNAYIFRHDWESDFFVQKEKGYSYEFEVKITRSDFFNDKKKVVKHQILQQGFYRETKKTFLGYDQDLRPTYKSEEVDTQHDFRPNKFFYVVPEGLIKPEEIPGYAGLFYYGEGRDYNWNMKKIKEPPFIHRKVMDFEKVLCSKFYHYWLNQRMENKQLKLRIKEYERAENESEKIKN